MDMTCPEQFKAEIWLPNSKNNIGEAFDVIKRYNTAVEEFAGVNKNSRGKAATLTEVTN